MSRKFEHKVETAKLIPRRGGPVSFAYPRGTILNREGKPIQAIAAPAGSVSIEARLSRLNAWREHLNPMRGLTIARAVTLLEDYQLGRMADLQWTFFFLEQTDPDMIGLLENRVSRILEMDYNVQIEKDAEGESGAQSQADYIAEKLAGIDNLYEAIEHVAMAPFRGYAHAEKHVNADGDVFHLEIVDQWNVVRDGMKGQWRYNPTARSCDFAGIPDQPVLPMERFLYRECRRPINRYALLKLIKSNLSEKDWDAFNEIYNVPGGVVIGPPDVAEDDESDYEAAAKKVAEGGSGYLPHGSTYEPNEMPHDPATFEKRLDYLSKKLVLAGTGGMLTMLAESGSGTLAGSVHDQVFNRIARAEARRISEIFNRQLIAPWLDEKFPGQDQVAYFCLAANEETDVGDAVEQVSQLSQAGYQVDPAQVSEKTGWKVTLKPQPTAPALGEGDELATAKEEAVGEYLANRRRRMRNAAAVSRLARFDANSDRALSDADRAAFAPLQAKVEAVAKAATPAEYQTALEALNTTLPDFERQVLTGRPDLEQTFEQVLAAAFVNGVAEAATTAAAPAKPVQNRQPAFSRHGQKVRLVRGKPAVGAAPPRKSAPMAP